LRYSPALLFLLFWSIAAKGIVINTDSNRTIVIGENFEVRYLDSLESALEIRKERGKYDTVTLELALELANKFSRLLPNKGIYFADDGLRLTVKANREDFSGFFYTAKGNIYREKGYSDLALDAYLKALDIENKYKRTNYTHFALIDIGNIYYDQRDYAKAIAYYQDAANRAETTNHLKALAVAQNNMALVYRQQGDYENALQYFLLALETREKDKDYILIGHSQQYISNLYLRMKEYDNAVKYIDLAKENFTRHKVWNELAWTFVTRGRIEFARGNFAAGQKAYEEAKARFKEIRFINDYNEVSIQYANQLFLFNRPAMAVSILKEALEYADQVEHLAQAKVAARSLYDHFKSIQDYKSALLYHEKLTSLDSISQKQEIDRKLADMELKFLLSTKESELLRSQESLAKQQVLIDKVRLRNRYLIASAVLSVLALMAMVWALFQKGRNNKKLVEQNEIIEKQKREIEESLHAIEKSKLQAEKLLQAKSEFLSHMSHEIRTPMNSIIGLTDLLMEEIKDTVSFDKLQSIKYAADLLLVIINDILDIASIEEGKIKLDFVATDLHRLFKELNNSLSFRARQKSIELTLEIPEEIPHYVIADPARLFQILLNLTSNAVKFTNEGTVHVSCKLIKQLGNSVRIRFEVKDTGIGIESDKQTEIFESFNQGSRDIQRMYGGTGLGLTITRRLLQMFDSEIKLRSTPGVGSEFSFEMNFELPEKSKEVAQAKQLVKLEKLTGLRLLYVEDNDMNQKVMSLLLNKHQITLEFAKNGQIALEMLQQNRYNGVMMDFHMPVMDGLACTREIRSATSKVLQPNIPVIGITADVFQESAREGLASGMNITIRKPIDKSELYEVLIRYCTRP